jgi:hypothetical protein
VIDYMARERRGEERGVIIRERLLGTIPHKTFGY